MLYFFPLWTQLDMRGMASRCTSVKKKKKKNCTNPDKFIVLKLFKPTTEELNLSDKRIESKYLVMSIKAQINSLKLVRNRKILHLYRLHIQSIVLSVCLNCSSKSRNGSCSQISTRVDNY